MLTPNDQSCPFCRGAKLSRYQAQAHDALPAKVNIVACLDCQAGWQWPLQRSTQQSAEVFQQAYAQHDDGTYFDLETRESVARCQVEFVNAKAARPGRLLDIGCGDAHFARQMARQGWDVVGLDPALAEPVDEALGAGRVSLQNASLTDLPPDRLFDVITLWDVVEHVEQPDQLLQAAAAYLAPGGVLIAETGNFQCAGRIDSGGTWWNYQMDHRWYLAPPQLDALLSRAGLTGIELADKVLRPWWRGQRDMQRPRLRSLVKAIATQPWRLSSAWRRHSALLAGQKQWAGWGGLEIMTMVARKAGAPARPDA